MRVLQKIVLGLAVFASIGQITSAFADKMTPQQLADARTKVETAVALAAIAEAEKDGDAMLVAAKMLSSVGPVAKRGEAVKDGKPTMYEVGDLVMAAKSMGADAAKAEELTKMISPAPTSARSEGYWYYSCDSYNNCQWIYAGY